MPKLRDLAKVIRSKNAKPFILTLDMLFETDDVFNQVKEAESLTRESIASLYRVAPDTVRVIPYPAARAIKITMHRWTPAGSFEDTDLLGAQQAVLLFDLDIPDSPERAREPLLGRTSR